MKKQKIVFFLVGVGILLVIFVRLYFTSFPYTRDKELGFEIKYPRGWLVQKLTNSSTYDGYYYSPVSVDFSDIHFSAPAGYVTISVSPTSQWPSEKQNQEKHYDTAKDLLDQIRQEKTSDLWIPGPPRNYTEVTRPFLENSVEVQSVRTYGETPDQKRGFLYWYVANDRVYEFFAQFPGDPNQKPAFEKQIQILLSSFKVI